MRKSGTTPGLAFLRLGAYQSKPPPYFLGFSSALSTAASTISSTTLLATTFSTWLRSRRRRGVQATGRSRPNTVVRSNGEDPPVTEYFASNISTATTSTCVSNPTYHTHLPLDTFRDERAFNPFVELPRERFGQLSAQHFRYLLFPVCDQWHFACVIDEVQIARAASKKRDQDATSHTRETQMFE